MPQPMQPQEIRNLGIYGVIRESEVDSHLTPDGAVLEAKNVHFDRKGAVTMRLGMANLGSTVSVGNACIGLHNVQSATLIAGFVNTIYTYSGSAWGANLTLSVSNSKLRFADFAGRTIMVSGSADSIQAWSGSADGASYWDHTGNPINPQQLNNNSIKPQFVEVYKSRVYVAGDSTYPDRLYFSSVISSAGNIAWTPSTDYVDINPNDGEHISALRRFSLELDVFKPNAIYRFRTTGVDPDVLVKVGTRSPESIVEGKRGLYFHHDTGFYRYDGGYPMEISRAISDFVDAIPYSQFSSISAWKDQDHIHWFVGDVTVNEAILENVTWKNVVLRYTESSDIWTIYSYANGIKRGVTFNNGTTLARAVGTDHGLVATLNSGYSDLGEPIRYSMVTKWYEWEGIATRKSIQQIISLCEKAQATTLMYQIDDESAFRSIGQMTKFIVDFESLDIRCHRIRFKVSGVNSLEPFVFLGLQVTQGINEGIIHE